VVSYIGCPSQFFFKEVRRVPSKAGYPMLLGSTGHAVLEPYNRRIMKTGKPPPFSTMRPVLAAAAQKNGISHKDRKRLLTLLFQYHSRYGRLFKPLFVEERRFLDFDAACIVTGKTDMVTADEVVDYKFSRVRRTRKDVADDLQLGFYSHLFGRDKARIVRLNPSGTVSTVGAPALPPQIVLDRIGAAVDGMRRGSYPPNHSFRWCAKKYCAFWSLCRGKRK